MTGTVAVLRREVAERRLLFAGAAALGLLPLAAPLLPGGYPELRGDMAVFLGQILSTLLALLLGATVVSRDLAEGRLTFYFSRPLTGGAVWAGKLGAAALLTGACGLLAVLPGWLAAGWGSSKVDLAKLSSWGILVLGLLFLAHAAGVLLRERSAWLLLDFVAFCAVATLIDVVERNSDLSGTGVYERVSQPGMTAALVILAAASAVQILAGRSDLRRGRRLLSLWLWPPLLAVAASLAVYSYRATEAEPRDLTRVEGLVAAPRGPWVAVSGPVRGLPDYHPGLLIDTRSGRSVLLPESESYGGEWFIPPAFSADARRVVVANTRFQLSTLLSVDLDRPGAEPVVLTKVGQVGQAQRPLLALSPDGRYLAQCAGGRLIVDDLTAGRLVATVPLPSYRSGEQIRFLANDTLRLFSNHSREADPPGGPNVRVQDLDLRTGQAAPPVVLRDTGRLVFLSSQDGRRLLIGRRGGALRLHDAATGEAIADLDPGTRHRQTAFLADGRPLLALPHPRGTELRVFQADGSGEPRRHLLEGVRGLLIGGQPGPASLVLATLDGRAPSRWRSVLLDLETGGSQPLGEGLLPPLRWGDVPGPDSLASRLFLRDGTLVLLDLTTGREQILTGEGAVKP